MKKLIYMIFTAMILTACNSDVKDVKLTDYSKMPKEQQQEIIEKLDLHDRSSFVKYTVKKELEAQIAGKKQYEYNADMTVLSAIKLGNETSN